MDAFEFLSTPSARRATENTHYIVQTAQFLSTPSARRATRDVHIVEPCGDYFYPRPLRGGRPRACHITAHFGNISIHALCEEGDRGCASGSEGYRDFYPRPLRGGRPKMVRFLHSRPEFLSTPSARRATAEFLGHEAGRVFLSTPSARRATFFKMLKTTERRYFYPRPLRGGRRSQPLRCPA